MNTSVTGRSSSVTSNTLKQRTALKAPLHCSTLKTSRFRPEASALSAQMQRVDGIDSLLKVCDSCTGVLLDQFGVLHDGKVPYPLAVAAVQKMAEAGKQIVILSNSSRRSGGTIGKLAKMGFKEEWFAGAITSGELTYRYLASRPTPWWQQLGSRCIHITWSSRGAISLEGLGLQVVCDPAEADFILAHGTEAVGLQDGGTQDRSLQQLMDLLQQCADTAKQRRTEMPMVVANPDLVTVDGPGLITMPGTLAKHYSQLGGRVQLMGKPDPLIYAAAQELTAQSSSHAQQWLAIGDSLEHDVAGGAAAGVLTLFVAGGIHAADVQLHGSAAEANTGCSWDESALEQLCSQHGVQPTYCMPYLQP